MTNEPLADVTTEYVRQADGTVSTRSNRIFEPDDYVINIWAAAPLNARRAPLSHPARG